MTYKILSLCGGGIRGLISARLLLRLKKEHGIDLLASADLLAGCSTGADIISYTLAGWDPQKIYDFYRLEAPRFFLNPNEVPSQPAYLYPQIVDAQNNLHGANTKVGEVPRKILTIAFDLAQWKAVIFHNLEGSTTADRLLTDAVIASSAMPGMFGAWKGMIDGAFVDHDPSLAAVSQVLASVGPNARGPAFGDLSVICVGTGLMNCWVRSQETVNWGALQLQSGQDVPSDPAIVNMPPLFINGTPSITGNAATNGPFTNMSQDMMANLIGPARYAYLNAYLGLFIPENETNEAGLEYMVQQADRVDLDPVVAVATNAWGLLPQ